MTSEKIAGMPLMHIPEMIEKAQGGESLFIDEVRDAFARDPSSHRVGILLDLVDSTKKITELHVPRLSDDADAAEDDFTYKYVRAEIGNRLNVVGARRVTIFCDLSDAHLNALQERLKRAFGIGCLPKERYAHGRTVNVMDRMINAVDGRTRRPSQFDIDVRDISQFDLSIAVRSQDSCAASIFTEAAKGLEGKTIIGLDIGGTDIKGAIAVGGALLALGEFNWDPASCEEVDGIISPIVDYARLLRVAATLKDSRLNEELRRELAGPMDALLSKKASADEVSGYVDRAERRLEGVLSAPHAIGVSFPDVVVRNKIVGGETPKTKGVRENGRRDYESEFAKLTNLDTILAELCKDPKVVVNINDGFMAAFTAAVEYAANGSRDSINGGVFAHTLGTDLGSGWVDHRGRIRDIPLETYKLIIDLGSYDAKDRRLSEKDVRSNRNLTTKVPGTLQRYTSQTGVFRLAVKYLQKENPALYQSFFGAGYLVQDGDTVYVPTLPVDMRKAFLEHLMRLAPENDTVANVFREVGVFLAKAYIETERILETGLTKRFLFGRLVMHPEVFNLMQEGAARIAPQLQLIAADENMVHTPLMGQLVNNTQFPGVTVAQFGQAVGAIHFANLHMKFA